MYEIGAFFHCSINSLFNLLAFLIQKSVVTPLLPAFPKGTYTLK